jgi:uncharacterized protein (DUF1697 family)
MRYVALLRGINDGGHKPLKMADLHAAFEGMGFQNVRTVQASGNVLFEAGGDEDTESLAARVANDLRDTFGYPIGVVIRQSADLERLVASDPFHGVAKTPETRLYVTFLSRPAENGTEVRPDLGKTAPSEVDLVRLTPGEVLTGIVLSPTWGTTELMAWLDKEFGAGVTTRNWNTIVKIVDDSE